MEELDLSSVLDAVHGKPVVLVPFKDQAGGRAVAMLAGTVFEFVLDPAVGFVNEVAREASHVVCFEHRNLEDICTSGKTVYDVKILYGGERKLFDLARDYLDPDMARNVLDREQNYTAHVKACKTAGIDVTRHSLLKLMPARAVQSLLKVRAIATMALFEKALRGESCDLGEYERDTWPFALALRQIEVVGIKVDVGYAKEKLREDLPKHEHKFISQMAQSDGYVRTLFNPAGGKTGRIKVEEGFNCMGIPHGTVRKGIVSRHEGGEIVAFDYNAIDYRSIVASLDDKDFRKIYDGVDDFHVKTCEMILSGPPEKLRRDIIKYFSYVYIYGGSDETLASKTRLSMMKVQQVKQVMDRKLRPIADFRRKLAVQARVDGFVMLPSGRKIPVAGDDHDGKIIGLYAQGFSSWVFEQALVRVVAYLREKRSKVIFTVHDELDIDMHPEEGKEMLVVKSLMEAPVEGFTFRANLKRGRTYGDATD
jgi:DNA polymerase I-like protein with 3'-5' exonuclease and polymerase domains